MQRPLTLIVLVLLVVGGIAVLLRQLAPADPIVDSSSLVASGPDLDRERDRGSTVTRHPVATVPEPELAAPRTAVDVTPPWEVDDDLTGIEHEKDPRLSRRRILTHYLHEFRRTLAVGVEHVDPLGLEAKQLHLTSIAALLDLSGRGVEEPRKYDVESMKRAHGADHVFGLNQNLYLFDRGEFPEYDRISDLTVARIAEPPQPPGTFKGHLQIDSDYYAALEARAIEALRALYDD